MAKSPCTHGQAPCFDQNYHLDRGDVEGSAGLTRRVRGVAQKENAVSKRWKEPAHILGVGCTRFGNLLETPELAGLGLQELAAMAAKEALADAGMGPQDVDAVFVGNVTMQTSQMPATYSQLANWLGTRFKAGVHFDAACSTTNVGATMAAMGVASGAYDRVLVVGLESTQSQPDGLSPYARTTIPTEEMWLWTDQCVNKAYSVPQGYDIFPTYNAFVAQGYCRKYGVSLEDLDRGLFELCRTRRLHGAMNPKAIRQQTLEDEAKAMGFDDPWAFWTSRYNPHVAWPSRLYSVVTPADGASAMVIGRGDEAVAGASAPVELKGFGVSVMDLPWYDDDPTVMPIDKESFSKAYTMAGIQPGDIDYLHTHDCSHIMSICSAEASGFLPEGQGLAYAREGRLRFDGDRPMSTHGGRHAFGHAWAASAGSDTYEAVKQIRGQAGPRQMPKAPKTAVIHTHGYAMISTVLVLQGGN
ncbi:MAG: thiolase family protein [Deltaproteobacteria bacterium]|nr:thiolase family protein [Deltaproteobacteria bacterium]